MVNNLNNLMRKTISSTIENGGEIMEDFYSLEKEEQKKIVRLLIVDAYKLNYFYNKKSLDFFNKVDEKNNIDSIIEYCLFDEAIIYDLMLSTKLFYDMDFVSKCVLMQDMENYDQDRILTSIYPLHILDRIVYQIEDDMKCYKKYYKNYLKVHKDELNRREIISNFIVGRMLDLKNTEAIKYKKYVLDMLKVYYKWKVFIKEHGGEYLLNEEDFGYIEIIKNNDIESLLNEFENNFKFTITVVTDYFHYTTEKIEIKDKLVDKYFEETSSAELQKKLKI